MKLINKASFSGEIDTKRKPFVGAGDGKKPFARVQLVQTFPIEKDGETHEGSNRQMIKIFGKDPVDKLKAAMAKAEKGDKVVVVVHGRLGSEQATGEQRVYKKKGSDAESRSDLWERILVVDGEDKDHGIEFDVDAKAA